MENILLVQKTDLQAFAVECVRLYSEQNKVIAPEINDALTKDQALQFLTANGYPLSSSTFYQKTATNEIPCRRIGKRLLFSRQQLQLFINEKAVNKVNFKVDATKHLAVVANKKSF